MIFILPERAYAISY